MTFPTVFGVCEFWYRHKMKSGLKKQNQKKPWGLLKKQNKNDCGYYAQGNKKCKGFLKGHIYFVIHSNTLLENNLQ